MIGHATVGSLIWFNLLTIFVMGMIVHHLNTRPGVTRGDAGINTAAGILVALIFFFCAVVGIILF